MDPSTPDVPERSGERIRVFLLDDHEVVRRGIRELLESESDIERAVDILAKLKR